VGEDHWVVEVDLVDLYFPTFNFLSSIFHSVSAAFLHS